MPRLPVDFQRIASGLACLTCALFCAADAPDFDKAVAPLLARRCLSCHNGQDLKGGLDLSSVKTALAGGESGEVLVPGKPDDSLLWKHVSQDEMPPKKPLPAGEKAILKEWIAVGAKWGTDPIDSFRYATDARAGYGWWALQPVVRPEVPVGNVLRGVPANSLPLVSIDAFVHKRLAEKGLSPSPPADRRVLLRRLSFDLLGLPPSPEEIAEFLADDSPDAYERLVDRLLASPRYGERWARHWLDVIRFGESQGFERDKLRETSWRYRDWCVTAFNRDLPYGEFARLQLAGDVLRPGDPAALVATGFLVAGPYDEVGQTQQSAAMRAVVRQDELEDLVGTVSQTFLGLTVNCARCHDHKFDPVRQSEYYRLAAALGGVKHGERELVSLPQRVVDYLSELGGARLGEREMSDLVAAGIGGRLKVIEDKLAAIEQPARERVLDARAAKTKIVAPPSPLASWEFNDNVEDASGGGLLAELRGGAKLEGGRLVLDGKEAHAATVPLKQDLAEKTLEAWVSLKGLAQRGGGVLSVQTLDGNTFDAIVFGEREPGRWMAGSNGFVRTQSFEGPEEADADKRLVHVAITYSADGTIAGYLNGQPYGKPYKSTLQKFQAGEAHVVFGLRHAPVGGNKMLAGSIDRARLYNKALSPDEVAATAGVESKFVSEAQLAAEISPQQRAERERLRFEAMHLRTARARAENMRAYAVVPAEPPATHVLKRGNPAQAAELVSPGGVASLVGLPADFGLPADAPDASRRKKLAEWITDAKNPLFARVIVNRLWQYHFGAGLVETPNDFGFNGARPTHAELLDWLACELAGHEGSLKSLHRQIVTSAAYRQSSLPVASAAALDADNRLLWRKEPLRLEAEAVRDAMLFAAGELSGSMGGPGYEDFTTFTSNSQFYVPLDPEGPSFARRSLYRTWVRSGRNRFLDVFDCPDPSTKTPRRAVTTTPLQALSLLNNSFVLRMSDRFAERVRRDTGDEETRQIARVYELAYGRAASPEEFALARPFVAEHGLAALCRVIFNSNEFLYVD